MEFQTHTLMGFRPPETTPAILWLWGTKQGCSGIVTPAVSRRILAGNLMLLRSNAMGRGRGFRVWYRSGSCGWFGCSWLGLHNKEFYAELFHAASTSIELQHHKHSILFHRRLLPSQDGENALPNETQVLA
jgi:hypothetical protein